ncbi:MFS transporter [Chitinophaga sedimenti]|uniref:MFS transporter n=1 Tax=Chitinophaga sedimenti TaxID=2033606 RepID=UPI002003C3AD|nr:MFS transporter [Chitinophaga sedimenti]MCK7558597.1 MFS transporter [Chitinophaga sedimenti]
MKNKGLFFTFFTASSIAIRLFAGKASDKYGRVPLLKISTALMAVSMFMIAISHTQFMLLLSSLIYGVALGINSPVVTAWTIDLGQPEHRGRALATMYIALEAGIGLGAYFSAKIYNNNARLFELTFYVMAAVTLLATIYLLFVQGDRGWKQSLRTAVEKSDHKKEAAFADKSQPANNYNGGQW